MTKALAIPLCLIDSMTARFISRTSSKTTQKQRYPTIEMVPTSSGGTCFANRKCAKGLPLSSASNILRVQGAEKQASSICRMSGRDSTVAGSMTHPPITPALYNQPYRAMMLRLCAARTSPSDGPSPPRWCPCRCRTRVYFSCHSLLTLSHRRQAAGLFVLQFCSRALYIERTDTGSCILTPLEPLDSCQSDRDG